MAGMLFSPNKSQHAHTCYIIQFIFSCCSIVVRLKIEQQTDNKRTTSGHMVYLVEAQGEGKIFFRQGFFLEDFVYFCSVN